MKKVLIGLVVTAALLGGLVGLNKSNDSSTASTKVASVQTKSFAAIRSTVSEGGALIDVRTAEEYVAGHIDGATLLPLQDIQAGKLPEVDTTKPVYVYCRSGNRSAQATVMLQKAGYTNITDLGAMQSVQSLGGNVVTGS